MASPARLERAINILQARQIVFQMFENIQADHRIHRIRKGREIFRREISKLRFRV